MKKTVCLLMMVLCLLFSPLTVSARTYEISGTDVTVNFDDSMWYVFTRDNLVGNPELDELGLDYDTFYQSMVDQDIVVDACLFYEDGDYLEVLIIRNEEDGYVNLSNYSDREVLALGKRTFEDFEESETVEVYNNRYKFFVIDFYDAELYLHQYVTVINGYSYSIQFQSPIPLTEEKYQAAREIVDGLEFDVDSSLKEPNIFLDTLLPAILKQGAIGLISAVVMGAVAAVVIVAVKSSNKQNH